MKQLKNLALLGAFVSNFVALSVFAAEVPAGAAGADANTIRMCRCIQEGKDQNCAPLSGRQEDARRPAAREARHEAGSPRP